MVETREKEKMELQMEVRKSMGKRVGGEGGGGGGGGGSSGQRRRKGVRETEKKKREGEKCLKWAL